MSIVPEKKSHQTHFHFRVCNKKEPLCDQNRMNEKAYHELVHVLVIFCSSTVTDTEYCCFRYSLEMPSGNML